MSNPTFARREFLHRSLAGVSVAGSCPLFLGKTAAALAATGQPDDNRALVVVQLTGGNDGLNTVVPYADGAYARARQNLRVPEKDVLKIDDYVGLHPNLKELKNFYDEGKMAIVQGTSYPNPTRSHFEAMDIWHAADPLGARRGSGWLGRAIESIHGNDADPVTAVGVGNRVPPALIGKHVKPVALQNPQNFRWRGRSLQRKAFQAINSDGGKTSQPDKVSGLDFLLRVANDAQQSSQTIREAVAGYQPAAEYPTNNPLANQLRLVSGMIAAGMPTRIYYVSLGSFDTHANQQFRHEQLLANLSTAMDAFFKDLRAQNSLDRVLVLSFSEFGRRVKENGSRGTDHGVAAPMFLFGNQVNGGLHCEHPSLTELVKGDLDMSVDFRQVYATVLDGWLGASSEQVLGKGFEPLDLLKTPV
ncbi:MAG TPA: DUF1501 domain-containing protein [Pirellulaceae bacterium]|nr:DUF1501 domain-containing protein [Pirellulaceae bacterium]